MTIIYSCIARGTTILCSHGNQGGVNANYEQASEAVLPSIPTRNDGKTTITASGYKFHCIIENGIIYMCTAKAGFETKSCFAYLTEIKDQFRSSTMSMRAPSAGRHEFDSEFNSTIAKQMDKFSKPDNSQLNMLQGQVKDVTGIMSKNIESVIQRGERLDDLVDKTDELEAASATFQKTASKIKQKYYWKNMKMKCIVGLVVFLIVTGIILAIVFGSGVLSDDDKDSSNTPVTAAPIVTPSTFSTTTTK